MKDIKMGSHGRAVTARLENEMQAAARGARAAAHGGRFSRIFPEGASAGAGAKALVGINALIEALAGVNGRMRENNETPSRDNPSIPLGFVFFGQFIDHDITLDVSSSLATTNNPEEIENLRTPALDLDSLYGAGPEDNPFFYEHGPGRSFTGKFFVANNGGVKDFPRFNNIALIGDPRNDENAFIANLHRYLLEYHNYLFDQVITPAMPGASVIDRFEHTRVELLNRYHSIIIHDYLPRICQNAVLADILAGNRIAYDLSGNQKPFIPIEFAAAAYRFGHTQIRSSYILKSGAAPVTLFQLPPFQPVTQNLEWSLYFDVNGSSPQPSREIDSKLAADLFSLPFTGDSDPNLNSLAFRNLKRALSFNLPSGPEAAAHLGLPVLTDAQLDIDNIKSRIFSDLGISGPDQALVQAPLWFYMLKESEIGGGATLGAVGSRIVGEVLVGLVESTRRILRDELMDNNPGAFNRLQNHNPFTDTFTFSQAFSQLT